MEDFDINKVDLTGERVKELYWRCREALAQKGLFHDLLIFDDDESVVNGVLNYDGFDITKLDITEEQVKCSSVGIKALLAREGLFHNVLIMDDSVYVTKEVLDSGGFDINRFDFTNEQVKGLNWKVKAVLSKAGLFHDLLIFDNDDDVINPIINCDEFDITKINPSFNQLINSNLIVKELLVEAGLFHDVLMFDDHTSVVELILENPNIDTIDNGLLQSYIELMGDGKMKDTLIDLSDKLSSPEINLDI